MKNFQRRSLAGKNVFSFNVSKWQRENTQQLYKMTRAAEQQTPAHENYAEKPEFQKNIDKLFMNKMTVTVCKTAAHHK